ncbi:hypothetical protein A9Q99_17260 [Gammaproteobacteria bacterium 45_16_T64]|mgnify:CR=1 FL=1|nr:hypothetical protein A9Q99_17260 [Gammaproteobacteria bacterium 45_16_T64]
MKIKGLIALVALLSLSGCDKINNMSRSMDTMLGGDYDVYIQGHGEVYHVKNGKVTSVPEKGYYVFYPIIKGKESMVQSPIQITTIVKVD